MSQASEGLALVKTVYSRYSITSTTSYKDFERKMGTRKLNRQAKPRGTTVTTLPTGSGGKKDPAMGQKPTPGGFDC
jgi:hypothetical protein